MSLVTWKEEFYPVSANVVSKEDALDHSIVKWTGLLKKNLEKHKLTHMSKQIADSECRSMIISSCSCALCVHFEDIGCPGCPLYASLGQRCDSTRESVYQAFTTYHDPEPMLAALIKAKKEHENVK